MRTNLLLLAAVTVSFTSTARADDERWPNRPEEMQVSLRVVHALENGPVVCQVSLTNVSPTTLSYGSAMFSRGSFCTGDTRWKEKKESIFKMYGICGSVGPYTHQLRPGATESHTFYLHKNYLEMPTGKATLQFGWEVYRIVPVTNADRIGQRCLETCFVLKGNQEIEVLPATARTLSPVLNDLEAKLDALIPEIRGEDYCWSSGDPSRDLVDVLAGCRHQEFVPLLLKAINVLPASDSRRELIGTLYDSQASSEAGFVILADCLRSPSPVSAIDVFEYWAKEDREHKESAQRQERLHTRLPPRNPFAHELTHDEWKKEIDLSDEAAWQTSKRHPDLRLTDDQFARLRATPNLWVRVLLYSHYPERCPDSWRATLLVDLKKAVQEPRQLRELVRQLDHREFRVREEASQALMALGPVWIPAYEALAKEASSAEQAHRLQSIIESLEDPVAFRLPRRTIARLVDSRAAHDKTLLEILTASAFPNLLSQAAKDVVAERKRRE